MKKYLALTLLIPALLTVGCSKGDDTGTDVADDTNVGTTYEVTSTDGDMSFSPVDLTIAAGDTVRFVMSATHNAIEVSEETYVARGVIPLEGGFQVNFSETKEVTFSEPGIHYYVCTPHVTIDMIGTITVE